MSDQTDILSLVREKAAKKILFLPHAVRQMAMPDRMIRTSDIRHVIQYGEVIENYKEDARGHSCLVLGFPGKRPVHIVCSPKEEYLAIITAYIPNEKGWENNYKKRKIK